MVKNRSKSDNLLLKYVSRKLLSLALLKSFLFLNIHFWWRAAPYECKFKVININGNESLHKSPTENIPLPYSDIKILSISWHSCESGNSMHKNTLHNNWLNNLNIAVHLIISLNSEHAGQELSRSNYSRVLNKNIMWEYLQSVTIKIMNNN